MSETLHKTPKSALTDLERVRDFQRKIYLKAKREKEFRFFVLYDKVRLPHFLREAYKRCRANKGKPGVDGKSFDDIGKHGVEPFLDGIRIELEERTYKPSPVLRVLIPKTNGKMRPLGIPTIKDRVVQMACKLVIEPIFEADFEDTSYGFRPKRSLKDAVREIKKNLKDGRVEVFDADLSSYFDTIPHRELLILIAQRISDKNIIHLIKMWLKAPIFENGRLTGGKKNKVGIPQGGVASPLLANIYINLLNKVVNRVGGLFQKYGVKIITYADDFVLMGRYIPKQCLDKLNDVLGRMKLTINWEKSRMLNVMQGSFDFLGFTFRYDKDIHGRKVKYLNIIPSKKSEKKFRQNIREYLSKFGHHSPELVTVDLNRKIGGWLNHITIPGVSYPNKSKRDLRYYLIKKLSRFYYRKSQRKSKLYRQGAFKVLVNKYDLIDPTCYCRARS